MTPILITLWLVCGLFAAYHAHLGLQHDCREEGISGDTPLGGMWIAWGPFLAVLIALGLLSLIVVCIIERDRLWGAELDEWEKGEGEE